jgi:hypothetical protein
MFSGRGAQCWASGLLLIVLGACSSDDSSRLVTAPSVASADASSAEGAAVTDPTASTASAADPIAPTVPQGTIAPPAPGSPNVCVEIASSRSLLTINDALIGLIDPALQGPATARLSTISTDLRRLAILDPALADALNAAALSLDAITTQGFTEATAAAAQVSIDALGTEVQNVCQFPVG